MVKGSKISWGQKSQVQKSHGVKYLRVKNLRGQKSQGSKISKKNSKFFNNLSIVKIKYSAGDGTGI